jgi:hypothetical protein
MAPYKKNVFLPTSPPLRNRKTELSYRNIAESRVGRVGAGPVVLSQPVHAASRLEQNNQLIHTVPRAEEMALVKLLDMKCIFPPHGRRIYNY